MRILAPFSFYGGKSKIAHLYPAPQHDLIVEPFAGSGAYAWLHRRRLDGSQRAVWLNDLDARTASIWRFLTSANAAAIVEAYVPSTVEVGQRISDFIPAEYPGLIELCRAEANQGTQGARGVREQVTQMGAKCWKVRRKALEVIPEVAHWTITSVSYDQLANVVATWFVDPPYMNAAGQAYRTAEVNYDELGWWCLNRRGQVICCENLGADWLPFEPFDHKRVGIRSRYQKADAREVMWTNHQLLSDYETRTATSLPSTPMEGLQSVDREDE